MHIKFYKALWGMTEGATLGEKFQLAREAGFDGIEADAAVADAAQIRDAMARHQMDFIAQLYVLEAEDFRSGLARAQSIGASKIVCHTGRDKSSHDAGEDLFREIMAMEADCEIPVAHETHRHRLLYSPWSTAHYLEAFPELKITLDLSHWCVVCESMLEDMPVLVDLAIERAIHVHARVGYEQGPQVPNPAAPEYQRHLHHHERWWEDVLTKRRADGSEAITFTSEFGPPNYMHCAPFTKEPAASHWAVNLWMKDHLKAKWGIR
ncbi:TIM barrel protein [soil metagenome]